VIFRGTHRGTECCERCGRELRDALFETCELSLREPGPGPSFPPVRVDHT
jgi:hypothetical protein